MSASDTKAFEHWSEDGNTSLQVFSHEDGRVEVALQRNGVGAEIEVGDFAVDELIAALMRAGSQWSRDTIAKTIQSGRAPIAINRIVVRGAKVNED